MARNKRPALTSPWKIGFFVSLLPIAVGIGVGYFITRAFGITWSWIEFHGTWSNWTFHKDLFMDEMFPVVLVVPAFSLLSYFLITGAVRGYRQYLDSGLDYKNLIRSIRAIDDLENEAQIRKLNNHPELRDFLLNLRRSATERRSALAAKEAVLAERETQVTGFASLSAETEALVGAVVAAHEGGLTQDLELEIPELRRVRQAIVDHLVAKGTVAGAEGERLAEIREDLAATSEALCAKLADIREELASNERSARDLEAELGRARGRIRGAECGPEDATGTEDAQRAVARLDSISEVLQSLGEETRSVAIKTALRASSGSDGGDSVVQLADDVRDVAAKFNGVAQQWGEAGEAARRAIGSVSRPRSGGDSESLEALDALTSKVGLWVERTVVLSEKLKTFDEHYRDALSALEDRLGGRNDTGSLGDWADESEAPTIESAEEAFPEETSEFERQGESSRFLNGGADVDVDTKGFERQDGLFSEMTGSTDDMFADIPVAHDEPIAINDEAAPMDYTDYGARTLEPKPELAPRDREAPLLDDDVATATQPAPERERAVAVGSTSPQVADDAIDLYELGAVDYEPGNIHHNA